MQRFDVIVLGLGAMGSATAYHLAARGRRVLGLERFRPGHELGSSHGDSRIIRELYFEHPMYVPLVQRSYELWQELEQRAGIALIDPVGGLMLGPADGELVGGTRRSAEQHGIPYRLLMPDEVHARYPAFQPAAGVAAILDPRAGYLAPEPCIAAHLRLAAEHGATLRFDEPALAWTAQAGGVLVRTGGTSFGADQLVITAGAWAQSLLPDVQLPLEVERQVVFWFDPTDDAALYQPLRFPIWAYEFKPGTICYGFPALAQGVKAAIMHDGEAFEHPDSVRRSVDPVEVEPLRQAMRPVLPGLARTPVRDGKVCLFTNAPNSHFLIDRHPEHPQVLISSPCSGHGFKFASAVGEIHADLLIDGRSRFDLSAFRLDRIERADV